MREAIKLNGPSGINLYMNPTREQVATVRRFLAGRKSVLVDFGNGDTTEHYAWYGNDTDPNAPSINPSRVINDIAHYYEDGIKPQGTPQFSINRNSDEYKKKVSDAAKRVEKRLAELHRSDGDEQSLKSNPIGNSADLNSSENYSPDKSGAQSVTQSAAKINKKLQSANSLVEKMADFVLDLPNRTDVTTENFAKVLVDELGLNPMQQSSEYIHYVSQDGDKVTLRVSDHEGNARNIILNGVKTDQGVRRMGRGSMPSTQTREYASDEGLKRLLKNFFLKKIAKTLVGSKKSSTFASHLGNCPVV